MPPTEPNITKEDIQDLEPIPGAWCYLRISYPTDNEFGKMRNLYPENTKDRYKIPFIHLRGMNKTRIDASFSVAKIQEEVKENIETSEIASKLITSQDQSEMQNNLPSQINETYIVQEDESIEEEEEEEEEIEEGRRGLATTIMSVKNHIAKNNLRVMVGLLEGSNTLIQDDNKHGCAFNTSIHNPFDNSAEGKFRLEENQVLSLNMINDLEALMNNKEVGNDIKFQEEYLFLRQLRKMYKRNKKDIWLGFQVVERPEEKSKLNASKNESAEDFEILGWTFFKLNNPDGSIKNGRFSIPLNKPPVRRPPVDPSRIEPLEMEIDFTVQEVDYDDEMLNSILIARKKKKVKTVKPKDNVSVVSKESSKVELNNDPYIPNLKQQFLDKPFEKPMGIDFYIDGARFLPDNVTVCKVLMKVINRKTQTIFAEEAGLPVLDSMSYMPKFTFRRELRKEWFDPTCMAIMTIITIDKSTNEVRKVGYSGIQLFVNRLTKEQPISDTDQDIVLYNGTYQLQIFCQEPYIAAPFSMEKLYKYEHLPCASLLVRINSAPFSEDGLRTLSIKDFPDPKDWVRKGIYPRRKEYGTGTYANNWCPCRKSEFDLFIHRVNRPDLKVREAAYLLVKGEGINKTMVRFSYSGRQIASWLFRQKTQCNSKHFDA